MEIPFDFYESRERAQKQVREIVGEDYEGGRIEIECAHETDADQLLPL